MAEKNDNEKEFGLKEIELKLISTIQDTYFANLSNVLSFIALERLGYNVTEKTRFRVEDGKVYIHEEEETVDAA